MNPVTHGDLVKATTETIRARLAIIEEQCKVFEIIAREPGNNLSWWSDLADQINHLLIPTTRLLSRDSAKDETTP